MRKNNTLFENPAFFHSTQLFNMIPVVPWKRDLPHAYSPSEG